MIKIKSGVEPHSLIILAAIANVAQELDRTVVITSGNDSRHMKTSLHYQDRALDIRSRDMPSVDYKLSFINAVHARLGEDYDCVLEDEGGPNEHIHIEYDPKSH